MANKRILESLERATEQHRLVFWYDANAEWTDEFAGFGASGVEKLEVNGTEFGAKVRIAHQCGPEQKFLIYLPSARPLRDSDNWLLDLVLQGYEFKADKASLALQEVGLAYEFKDLVEKHADFFKAAKRLHALKDLVAKEDQAPQLRLKMMSILAGIKAVEIDALLLHFLRLAAEDLANDPVKDALGAAHLVEPFWKEVARFFGYPASTPSLKDFAVFLFRAANPLDGTVQLRPHAKVFLQRWKDSRDNADAFRTWSESIGKQLHVHAALEKHGEHTDLGDADTFELFDKFVIQSLCRSFKAGATAADLRATIQQRRSSFWNQEHEDGYKAIDQAIELRELMASAELSVDSIDAGLHRYVASWWRIDMAYRRCVWHLRRYGQTAVMGHVSQWVEKTYVGNYLQPLADRWGDKVVQLPEWGCEALRSQRQFFTTYVQPVLNRGQKVFVIISDALRYEAAADFASQLNSEKRWSAEVEAVLGSLPSYTQLGMAALLPGQTLTIDPKDASACVGGMSAKGTANRAAILKANGNADGAAIKSTDFLALNSKTDGRDLFVNHDVIYIFHNKIDKVGDTLETEQDAFDAVADAFDELRLILKKVSNINGTHMLLTSDHGFLFQQDEVEDKDATPLPASTSWAFQNRRFAFNTAPVHGAGVKTFTSTELGLLGDWNVTFPLSLGRFPLRGSGKRFVHGGFSLQEVVVPVVRIRKARADDTTQVEVDLMRVPQRITTGKTSLSLYQDKPVTGKTLPRTVRVAIFAPDGTQLSDARTHVFDLADPDARNREVHVLLTLSAHADKYNNQDLEIRLDEAVDGTDTFATYRQRIVRLHKPFTSDFDD